MKNIMYTLSFVKLISEVNNPVDMIINDTKLLAEYIYKNLFRLKKKMTYRNVCVHCDV